jgi:hypothetical protein
MPEDWIEHRRGLDGERLGWMKPVGDGFVVIDLLGREQIGVVDWCDAEETLDGLGSAVSPIRMSCDSTTASSCGCAWPKCLTGRFASRRTIGAT